MTNYLDEGYWNAKVKQKLKAENKSRSSKTKRNNGRFSRKGNGKIPRRFWAEFKRQEEHIRDIVKSS